MTNPEYSHKEQGVVLNENISYEDFLEVLVSAKVPVELFEIGPAKSVRNLLDEVQSGESVITVRPNGELLRALRVVWVDVYSVLENGDIYHLREDRQEFKDGRVKRRQLNSSLGEKLKPSESSDDAVVRALEEELGVAEIDAVEKTGYEETVWMPDTYPGVESSYKFYKYAAIIPESEFNPDGYIETQPEKTNYYAWDLIHSAKQESGV